MQKKGLASQSIKIFPSILSADFGQIAEEAKRAETAGADGLHLDIMDGHFVPNLTFGPKVVAAINRATPIFLDVHLMIYNPFEYVERFVESGADRISFHVEATEDVQETLAYIRKCGVKSGLAINPETPPEMVEKYLVHTDMILIMSVAPGFGGQKFMPAAVEKIEYVRDIAKEVKAQVEIQVDGGINEETAKECVKAGAHTLVSGDYLFKAPDMKKAIAKLRGKT